MIAQSTLAVTLKIAFPASTVTDIRVLSVASCLAAAAWVRVMVTLSVPASVAASVRIASLLVIAVFSSYVTVIF